MGVSASQIQKINYFSKVPEEFCSQIAEAVVEENCPPALCCLKKVKREIQCF